jgi:hypothetical protein
MKRAKRYNSVRLYRYVQYIQCIVMGNGYLIIDVIPKLLSLSNYPIVNHDRCSCDRRRGCWLDGQQANFTVNLIDDTILLECVVSTVDYSAEKPATTCTDGSFHMSRPM